MTESRWIDYFGFQRFPFDRPEAGNEEFSRSDFLATCFVEPPNFERVLGQADAPVTALLFADRGSGKTACRVMLDYYCKQGQTYRGGLPPSGNPAFVLSILHIHLHQVTSLARQAQSIVLVQHHAEEILRRAVPAMTDMAAKAELVGTIRKLSLYDQQDLNWLIVNYGHYLTSEQAGFWHDLEMDEPRPPIGFHPQEDSPARQPRQPKKLLQGRSQTSPLDLIEQWAELMHKIGITACYVLVDGIDEFEESAGDPRVAFAIVRPLLACLRLMDGTRHLALKFFLPASIKPFFDADKRVRHDRGFVVESIIWSEENLIEILRRRLDVLKRSPDRDRDRTEIGFDALCVPELRGQIEHDLASWARGNPRHLFILCGLMVTAHCASDNKDQDDPYQLNKADLQIALEQFEARIGLGKQVVEISTPLPSIHEMLANGENERIEFKSSIRWDFSQDTQNKGLQKEAAKAIAGMLNSEGGLLLIGVADDGAVLGIENDLQTLKKASLDAFQLALTDIIDHHLGAENLKYIRVRFEEIDGKQICVVLIDGSEQPVYFFTGEIYEFWLRTGNSTRRLDAKETTNYITTHWKRVGANV